MKKYLALTAVAIALLFLFPGCPEKDTTTPTVKITEPANNATLTAGNITIKAVATDDKEMGKVEFWVDGAKKAKIIRQPMTHCIVIPGMLQVRHRALIR